MCPFRRYEQLMMRPFGELQPAPLTPVELGDGSQALSLEQKLGLL